LKIPLLLVQFLYMNRKMSLPGLGIFTLDKTVILPDEHDRTLLSMPNAVQFQNANIAAADKELITYICENTGKIRPLAISDLDSFLNLGMEMLNIGKPFHLEGIGTITKNKSGKFDFMPGGYTVFRESGSSPVPERKKAPALEKKQPTPQPAAQNRNGLKLVILAVALAVVGWGGWEMYKKPNPSNSENNPDSSMIVQHQQPAITDTPVASNLAPDSTKSTTNDSVHPAVQANQTSDYKFIILATTDKPHAMRRYNQLSSFDLKVHLYQKDSSFFKVYFQIPALAKDTARIKDSLRREYAHEVLIEQ
jgi:hypothetical protein